MAIKASYVHPDYPATDCVYCGELATTKDHLLPRSYTGEAERLLIPTVPACIECNSTLNDIFMPDVIERREYLKNKYRKKYKNLLKIIWYSDEDLMEFGPQLRTVLMDLMQGHITLMGRLSWPRNPTYDADAWAGAWEEPLSVDPEDLLESLGCLKSPSRGTVEPLH